MNRAQVATLVAAVVVYTVAVTSPRFQILVYAFFDFLFL